MAFRRGETCQVGCDLPSVKPSNLLYLWDLQQFKAGNPVFAPGQITNFTTGVSIN